MTDSFLLQKGAYARFQLYLPRENRSMQVQCYSGVEADERAILFQLDGHEYRVVEVLDRWYGPEDTYFKLRADDHNIYILRYHPATDAWSLESFRQG